MNKKQTLINITIVVAIIAIAAAFHFSSNAASREATIRHNEERCRQNLSEMFRAARRLRRASGQWPTSLVDVANALNPFDPELMVCPASDAVEARDAAQVSEPKYTSYHLEPLAPGDARQPLIVENAANHDGMRLMVFTDGAIEMK